MNVTAGTDSINKKQTNSSLKRSYSSSTFNNNNQSKYIRITKNESIINNINVRDYFFHERTFSNVKIKFHNDIIWCDKSLLSAASPVLCQQLLKLNNSKDDLLSFDDINIEEFLLFLQFIYPIFNPEINQQNISALIQLSHRFQFDVLKNACQLYILKYLSTIRQVINKYQHSDSSSEIHLSRQYDLIEFHDGTCIDGYDIILSLCQWVTTYFYEDNMIILQAIISILQQISIDNLIRIMNRIDINDDIKVYIYKERAQYLEDIYHRKHLA